jgi:hypothetical protein
MDMRLKKAAFLILLLLVLVSTSGFARQDVETHTFHFGLNPFTWIFGLYNGEIAVPLTGFLELAGQFDYLDGKALIRMMSGGEDYEDEIYFSLLRVGPLLRLFPTQNATGFFLSIRLMYLMFHGVDEWDGIDETYHDLSVGTDIGWRYLWEFDTGWGMYVQGYFGLERFLLNEEIADFLPLPIFSVYGLQIGFHF